MMKKEIFTYFLVFCLFGTVGVGVVKYFGPDQKVAKVEDSCEINDEGKSNHIVNPANSTSDAKTCENEEKIIE